MSAKPLVDDGEHAALPKRSITEETCKSLDYQKGRFASKPVHIANYYDDGGQRVAQKLRFADKTFTWRGDPSRALLFGQHKWPGGTRRIVITEGEIDALSVAEAFGRKWPVVSVKNGAQGAAESLLEQLDFLETFEEVCIFFDQDEPGQAAAQECAELFTPGKARIVRGFPFKDANDALVAGETDAIVKATWNAVPFWPDDILEGNSDELWNRILEEPEVASLAYPWESLNKVTYGIRRGEIVLWTAGSGIGKSQLLRETVHHNLDKLVESAERVGIIALEESVRRTALGMMSLAVNKPLHLDRSEFTDEQLRAAFDATVGSGSVLLYDHWGSLDSTRLLTKVRTMVRAGCSLIVLDHISIVISGSDEADGGERRVIDKLMTRLRSLVEELDFSLHVVCHLRKANGTPHEEGGRVTLDDLRGSGSLKQLSDIIIAAERNSQSDDPNEKTLATLRVIKNRFTGETGIAGAVRYSYETGRYTEDNECGFEDEADSEQKGDF